MNVCAGGLSSPSGRCHPLRGPQTTREAGQNSQAVFTQEARAGGGQAGSLPGGGTRCELLDMTNPPRGTGPGL